MLQEPGEQSNVDSVQALEFVNPVVTDAYCRRTVVQQYTYEVVGLIDFLKSKDAHSYGGGVLKPLTQWYLVPITAASREQ